MLWEILHIPGKTPNSLDDSLVDVLASTIEPKLANSLVRRVNRICPLETLRHIKRVRRRTTAEGTIELSVILCLSYGPDDPMEGISDDLRELISEYNLSLFRAKVAKYAASSREEWEEQSKLWPTSYHPSTNLDGTSGFSEDDSQLSFDYMRTTIRLAKLSCLPGKVVNAAVIVDPLSKRIIASANDETCCSPTSNNTSPKDISCNDQFKTTRPHLSIAYGSVNEEDSVAKPSPNTCGQSYTEVSCLYPWGWTAQKPHNESSPVKCGSKSNISWHPLRHAALVAIDKAAARDRQLFPGPGLVEDQSTFDDSLQHLSNGFQAKRQKTEISEDDNISGKDDHTNGFPSEEKRPYLCTGFDIYLVWEPCTMCAMALVHQRIRRIFYAFPNPNAGALGSVYRLQGEKSLNHHYSVFRILLPEKCLDQVETE